MRTSLLVMILTLGWMGSASGQIDRAAPLEVTLLKDVRSIDTPGSPGTLCVFGNATPLITGEMNDQPVVVAAAGTIGRGRVVALAHNGYFAAASLERADTGRLIINAARWARSNQPAPIRAVGDASLLNRLRDVGLDAQSLGRERLSDVLPHTSVLIIDAGRLHEDDLPAVEAFVRGGGGLITGLPGWGWKQLNPGKSLADDLPMNRLLMHAGIVIADGHAGGRDNVFAVGEVDPLVRADVALDAALQGRLPAKSALVASAALLLAADALPSTEPSLRPRIDRLLDQPPPDLRHPQPDRPLRPTDVIARVILILQERDLPRTPMERIRAHPSADAFPGAVTADAPRVRRALDADHLLPGWNSTGLYAAPGETVIVRIDPVDVAHGLSVRIGAHSDGIAHLRDWKRAPRIDRVIPITEPLTRIASPFGGLVYIESRDRVQVRPIEIEGAVEAPRFVLGRTSPAEWTTSRQAPGPWGELIGEKIILTLPASALRELESPTALMQFWDRVADACADLATIPHERVRPERYVADVQISAGYMHAGYPIMTHLDAVPRFVDLDLLRTRGDWGMFHEIGHNHQSPDWTFDGTGEVTVNLFTMYVMETLVSDYRPHPSFTQDKQRAMWRAHRASGSPFEQWKRDPFLALVMYRQLIDAFGWDAFKRVFAEYRALPADQRPRTDDDKRDQWMIRMSRTTGRNLGPFFDAWGVPTSPAAKASIADLPVWMPEN